MIARGGLVHRPHRETIGGPSVHFWRHAVSPDGNTGDIGRASRALVEALPPSLEVPRVLRRTGRGETQRSRVSSHTLRDFGSCSA